MGEIAMEKAKGKRQRSKGKRAVSLRDFLNSFRALTFASCLLPFAFCLPPALAHPMGNFTISHFSELTVAPGEVRLHYALDMAEIPTVQERQKMDRDGDGKVSPAEAEAYRRQAMRALPAGLRLRVNGSPTGLVP